MGLLRQRLGRFGNATRLAYTERGFLGGTRFVMRTVCCKFILLFKSRAAQKEVANLRYALRAARQKGQPGTPYIGLAITGGIGDLLVIARVMRDLGAAVGGIYFDVYVKRPAIAAWVFSDVPGFGGAYFDSLFHSLLPDYDVAVRASQFAMTYADRVRWPVLRDNPRMADAVFALMRSRLEMDEFVEVHPYQDNVFAAMAVRAGWTRRDYMHHQFGVAYGGDRLDVPSSQDAIAVSG